MNNYIPTKTKRKILHRKKSTINLNLVKMQKISQVIIQILTILGNAQFRYCNVLELRNRRQLFYSLCCNSGSETSGISLLEETYVDEAQEICSQDVGNSKNKVSLDTAFRNVLQEHTSLHEKILLYEPVWLESMKLILKDHGARCSMNELMNYLDEKVGVFETAELMFRYLIHSDCRFFSA